MNKITFLKNAIFTMVLFFSITLSAQTEPEVIKDWTVLEEADYLVDVSYKIVKCSTASNPEILLNVFNESGIKTNFGFTLHLKGANNNTEDVVLDLSVPQATMHIASCENNQYPKLKFNVPTGIDVTNLSITITYKE
jgi:hypothetical protein